MADRDLYELIEGADNGLLSEIGDGWRKVGMRWRPRPEPGERPARFVEPTGIRVHVDPLPVVTLVSRAVEAITRKTRHRSR